MFKLPQRLPGDKIERPQKHIETQDLMFRLWRTCTSYLSKPIRSSIWIYRPILWRIKRRSSYYFRLSEHELDEAISNLTLKLRQSGLTHSGVVEAFALIREVSGRELEMRHFDSQILGGLSIIYGTIGQMQTGEGKTLTATLPVAAAALAGVPTHVVTVNDYLTARDAELMEPVYKRLGLSLGVVTQESKPAERIEAYQSDIVYCTNNELAFDYLKDSVILRDAGQTLSLHARRLCDHSNHDISKLMMRGLHFAVVDEADGVFMDEATTPLILSGEELNQHSQLEMYQQALSISSQLLAGEHYTIDTQLRTIEISSKGKEKIDDLTSDLGAIWKGRVRRLELVRQALTAQFLFLPEKHYIVEDNKIVIVDEHTGRKMPDRTWERGLHQLIEIKEACEVSSPRLTLASISFQNFFRMYEHLSGMTGTADEVKSELWNVYELPVVDIPTNKKSRRNNLGRAVFNDVSLQNDAVVNRIKYLHQVSDRPILIGTTSVKSSEILSNELTRLGLKHQVLNAKQDSDEAGVVAQAGVAKAITIATSMAGRGTDIKLDDLVEQQGGLHVIITGLHESSRVDRQLVGRCARQGDQGSFEFILSLDDSIITNTWRNIAKVVLGLPLPIKLRYFACGLIFRWCQRSLENRQKQRRKELLIRDEREKEALAFSDQRT